MDEPDLMIVGAGPRSKGLLSPGPRLGTFGVLTIFRAFGVKW